MKTQVRHRKILEILEQSGSVSVTELAVELGVSENTVRNDLDALNQQGTLVRTHGGAASVKATLPPGLRPRNSAFFPGAEAIVEYALSWIGNGDSIILGEDHLCVLLAERIAGLKDLRVITPSLPIAYLLAQEPGNRVVVAGGVFDFTSLSTSGAMAGTAIQGLRADKAFFSCTGVSVQGGLTDQTAEKAQLHQAMLGAADSLFVLVESNRVGKADLFPVGSLTAARRIITDSALEAGAVQALADACARVAICSPGTHQTYRQRFGLGRKVKIGFANLSHGIWFSQQVNEGIQAAARKIDGLELLVADNQTNPEIAIQNAEKFLDQEIDLLVEYDGTGLAIRSIRQLMREADVPIIAIDIPILGATHIGSDHDAIGAAAGKVLGRWIRENWGGQVDQILWLNSEGGATVSDNLRIEDWQNRPVLGSNLSPVARFASALESIRPFLRNQPKVNQLVLPGGWATSEEAVSLHFNRFTAILPTIPENERVLVICLVCETALGFAQAVRLSGRCGQFVVTAFGDTGPAVRKELAKPETCLLGVMDLHPERYGQTIMDAAVKLLKGEAVSPAIFVDSEFLSREEVQP